ncbi:kinesin-domain-containing protein [Imleria badia]|nr:kinesin-domain-containing protein [Imleria badia]
MAGRAKASAPATRASTRTKTPPVPSPSPPPAIKAIKAKPSTRSTAATKTTVSRKPLANRPNLPDVKSTASKRPGKQPVTKSAIAEQEPIMAYLRIRPRLGDDEPATIPYLDPLSDTAVRMTDPSSEGRGASGVLYRTSTTHPSSIYKFSHVFPPSTQQTDFFAKTTLPFVQDLLDGQNALIFAYGVTNSGKTYTIQGRNEPGSGGILPRTLDVIFNSVEGLQSDGRFRPVRLYGVGEADPSDFTPPPVDINVPSEPALAEVLAEHMASSDDSGLHADPTVIKLDRNYEYSVWISYVEVYNEKVYDLLASANDDQENEEAGVPRSMPNVAGQGANPVIVTRKALAVKPCPAHDAMDDSGTGNSGRYVSGLKQFRVTSAAQAKSLVKLGQLHRRVFGTLANSQSSRSHSMITIKILRNHRGDRDDPSSVQISRLTLVDLAGSERMKHTQTTGDRLKEAGNINKSLMVLGQCMEVMRSNQKRLAQSLANPGQSDTRDVKRALAVVPFRHSKLTEILMDYFAGDGRVTMIVNVNPYDTGFDENSHVMKFSALTREISTVVNNAPIPRVHTSPTKPSATNKLGPSGLPRAITRKVTISSFGPGKKVSEAHLEVLEEDEEVNDDQEEDSDDEPINPLVDALFDEIEDLRLRLYEAEMRCAIVEVETREEVMREMEERMRAVERTYALRLMSEVERNERKMDAKIDMLHQAGLLGTEKTAVVSHSESEIEDISAPEASGQEYETDTESEMPSSPLHGKGNPVTSKTMEHYNAQTEGNASRSGKTNDHGNDTISDSEDEEDMVLSTNDDASDDYIPPTADKNTKDHKRGTQDKVSKKSTGKRSTRSVSKLEREIQGLSIGGDALAEADDSVVILPNRKLRREAVEAAGPGVEYVPEVDPAKKKKRCAG